MLNPEEDIEHIYRDFAQNYPLKVNDTGWAEFEQKLDKGIVGKPAPAEQNVLLKARIIKLYRVWLAAVVLVAACTIIFLHIHKNNAAPAKNVVLITNDSSAGNAEGIINNSNNPANDTATSPQIKNNAPGVADTHRIAADSKSGVQTRHANRGSATLTVIKKLHPEKIPGIVTRDKHNTENEVVKNQDKPVSNTEPVIKDNELILNTTGVVKSTLPGNDTANIYPQTTLLPQNNLADSSVTVSNSVASKLPSTAAVKGESGVKKTTIHIKTLPHRFFYLGAGAGPAFNTVKLQAIKAAGFSTGVLAGVQLSGKVNIETGVYYSKKNYYSAGRYVNTKNLQNTDPDDVLKSVDGNAGFWEIPVVVGLNVASKNKHSFYVSAGLSSLFTGCEKYELHYQRRSGIERTEDEESNEKESNFFAAIPLRAGYKLNLDAKNILRIEPYVNIPLYGIGRFSLPVVSSGIYVNIIHSFF
ncbi:MAG TPA: hypothetical protein VHB48_05590 [Chitinophagaceae bacterium]|nr:hypothetical protein [Chitinophagaceae bacterium]